MAEHLTEADVRSIAEYVRIGMTEGGACGDVAPRHADVYLLAAILRQHLCLRCMGLLIEMRDVGTHAQGAQQPEDEPQHDRARSFRNSQLCH